MPGEDLDTKDTNVNTEETKTTESNNVDPVVLKELQDEITRLKAFQATVVAEKQTEKEKRQAAERDRERAKAEAENDFKKLLELKDQELAERDKRWQERDKADQARALKDKALEIAGELATDVKRAKVLADIVKDRIQLTADGVKVLDENGNLTITPVQGLLEQLKKEYPFLIDGLQSTGTGTKGSGNNTSNIKSLKDMSEKEQVQLYTENYKEWKRLSDQMN